ncbi:amino acid ABC transporter substrate-binding protein [Bacillus sp. V33-4]|nr:amino acid ABC transporter substrate-binding protein [Bacillus sp. V33-4]
MPTKTIRIEGELFVKKLTLLFALLFSFMLIISACGTNDNNNEADNNQENNAAEGDNTEEDLLVKVKEDGKLLIGTEGTYPPFSFHDDKGELTGFDVELATEVSNRLDVEPVFMETQWDAMFAGLDSKRFDMIANQVGIKPDREEKYDFSKPYITSAAVLITRKDNTDIKNFEDLEGKKSAQSMTSNYAELAKSYGAEIVGVEGFNQAIELLNSNRVDATINDKLSFLDFTNKRPDAPIKIAATSEDAAQSGLMFRKGSGTLVEEVNNALDEIIADGTYEQISKKWFGENVLE